jgi:glycine/D-amino acid oxidase-like deaminating enzyme
LDLRSGYPFSLIRNGLIFNYPKLEKSVDTEVAIIGGGISGALVAYHLTMAGVSCIVTDGRTVGLGSTAASTSLLQYEIDVPLTKLTTMVGYQNASRAFILCNDAIEKLGKIADNIGLKDFRKKNSLYFAASKRDVKFLLEECAIRKRTGFNVEYLTKEDIANRFAFESEAAILSQHGAQSDAYLFTHHLLQHAIKKGLQVYDRTKIERIDNTQNQVVLKTAQGNSIRAKKMINASGYEVINFIGKKYVKLHSTYAVVSEHQSRSQGDPLDDTMLWNTADPYLYITSIDNRVIVGGRDENYYSPSKRDALIKKKSKQLRSDFLKLFPARKFSPEFSWTGTFGTTRDGLPFIGSLKNEPNIYYALGFGGNGITFSQIAAEIIADLITGKKNDDVLVFSFDR